VQEPETLPAHSPLAIRLQRALERGDAAGLDRLIEEHPGISSVLLVDDNGDVGRPLHLYANAPGHRPHPAEIVGALVRDGADIDAPVIGAGHQETALHWAASNDDVELIDALLDAGADIERPGSSINGGSPLQSAIGYGQMQAVRRLVERGAVYFVWHAAALGMMTELAELLADAPSSDDLGGALWQAARNGQIAAGQLLVEHGADVNWRAPWSDETPLDIARAAGRHEVAAWLLDTGAAPGASTS
jgi:ankyrin repeat protein